MHLTVQYSNNKGLDWKNKDQWDKPISNLFVLILNDEKSDFIANRLMEAGTAWNNYQK